MGTGTGTIQRVALHCMSLNTFIRVTALAVEGAGTCTRRNPRIARIQTAGIGPLARERYCMYLKLKCKVYVVFVSVIVLLYKCVFILPVALFHYSIN